MKTLVVGDIHGCYAEFMELLDVCGLSAEDRIVALGDIVDRGPATPEVLAYFQASDGRARALMGNHERKHVRSFRGEIEPALSQVISREQIGAGYATAVEWMSSLPLYLDLPEAVLVHGFLEPGVPLQAQRDTVLCGTLSGADHLRVHYAKRWYELYDGAKPVLVGQESYLPDGRPLIYRDLVYGLDTNCVRGGKLTGLVLPDFRVVSVRSRRDYWLQAKRQRHTRPEVKDLVFTPIPPSRFPGKPPADPSARWSPEEERLLAAVLESVRAKKVVLESELQRDPSFGRATPREQAMLFADRIGDDLLAPFYHLERQGRLDECAARRIFRNPRQLRNVVANLRLSGREDHEDDA